MKKMSEWKNVPKDLDKYFGFVYCITNTLNGRQYLGKKFLWKDKKLKPLKGKKNKRHFKVETDWKNYWGSSKELLEDIEKHGKKNFEREILLHCETKWGCAYYEAKMQFDLEVLFDKHWYNNYIGCRLKGKK